MLSLKETTAPRWLAEVERHVPQLLLDHAHCEKKAAGVAMNLIFTYGSGRPALCRELSEIVVEELAHFRLVLDLLAERGLEFCAQKPSEYGGRLNELVRRVEPARAVDRLLVAALIEARSCERFGLLRDQLADRRLADFYGSLFESEARHHSTYVQMAQHFAPLDAVRERLDELAMAEAHIIRQGSGPARMHS